MMSFTYVTCTGTVTLGNGSAAARALVLCTLSAPITNNGVTVGNSPFTTVCDTGGNFSLPLPANDDTGTTPSSTSYLVQIFYANSGYGSGLLNQFDVTVSQANAPTVNLLTGLTPLSNVAASGNSVNLGNIGSALTINVTNQSSPQSPFLRVTANTASGTITFAGVQAGSNWTLQHVQDNTGSRRTIFNGVTWLSGAGAVTPAANSVDVFNFYSPDGIIIYGFQATSPVYGQPVPYQSTLAFETLPRWACTSGRTISSGFTFFQHFVPDRDLVVSNISVAIFTIAAGLTQARTGIAQYTGSGNYTTVATTTANTTQWNSLAYVPQAITGDGQGGTISSVLLKAGFNYAVVMLAVGTTAPQLAGQTPVQTFFAGSDAANKLSRIAISSSGSQTDIQSSYSGLNGAAGSLFWAALY